jgi:hypothetical protein
MPNLYGRCLNRRAKRNQNFGYGTMFTIIWPYNVFVFPYAWAENRSVTVFTVCTINGRPKKLQFAMWEYPVLSCLGADSHSDNARVNSDLVVRYL